MYFLVSETINFIQLFVCRRLAVFASYCQITSKVNRFTKPVRYFMMKMVSATVSTFISSNTFHILRPAKAPAFSYAWLELISHRVFIGRMLAITTQQRVGPHSTPATFTSYNLLSFTFIYSHV